MKIRYMGNRNWWNENRTNKIRMALIEYDDFNDKDCELAREVERILVNEYGWNIDGGVGGVTMCEVCDYEEYEAFKEDYLEAKKQARKNINAPKEVKQIKKVLNDDIYNVVSANLITNNRNEDEEKAYEEVVFLTSKECLEQLEEVYKYYGDDDQIGNAIYDGFTYDGEYRDLLEDVICNIIFYVKDKVDKEEKEEATKEEEEEEASSDEEVTASNEEIAPSPLNFYSRKRSIKAWKHVKCENGVTAIRSLKRDVETSDKLPNEDRKLLLEWLGDEKEFLEILDGYEHAYAVNHGWGIDLIEENKGLWFISVYIRKNGDK